VRRVLVLGATGMLGHKLVQMLAPEFEVHGTVRGRLSALGMESVFGSASLIEGITANNPSSAAQAIVTLKPEVVINCIGLVKQLELASDPVACIEVNALFPHFVARACESAGARLIQFSTDCVFSGAKGEYSEDDVPDPVDLYGRSKLLGEVCKSGVLTIRTSVIGRQLTGSYGLLEWLLSGKGGRIRGYKNAIYTGFTTIGMARIVASIVRCHPQLEGLWHVSSDRISKMELLCLARDAFRLDVEIQPDVEFRCDRSLQGTKFWRATGMSVPGWPSMILELAADPTPYDDLRERLLCIAESSTGLHHT